MQSSAGVMRKGNECDENSGDDGGDDEEIVMMIVKTMLWWWDYIDGWGDDTVIMRILQWW